MQLILTRAELATVYLLREFKDARKACREFPFFLVGLWDRPVVICQEVQGEFTGRHIALDQEPGRRKNIANEDIQLA